MQSEQCEKRKRQLNLRSFGYCLFDEVFLREGSFIVKMALPCSGYRVTFMNKTW